MRTYRINCTGEADQIISTHAFSCRNDLAALDKARQLCADHGVEVLDGERRVVWMHKGGAVRVPGTPMVIIPSSPYDALAALLSDDERQRAS